LRDSPYSVVETKGFAHLLHTFFHPRDWADGSLDDHQEDMSEHENDTEGVLVVERNSSPHGTPKAAVTITGDAEAPRRMSSSLASTATAGPTSCGSAGPA
jgi:hypothetical protein